MALDPSLFEKLGVFYLGRPYDLAAGQGADEPLLYDSRDLTTHAVCVGMTGSGKTGLCLALLEEAALDGVPAIVIDPKGDLTNIALTFPELRAEDFRPWIHPEDAARKGMDTDAYAAAQAKLWKDGLAKWGQGPERIRQLREKAEVTIYTPGSSAGVPVNVLASFDAPDTGDAEALADRAQTAAASLLALLKLDADAAQSREGILLSSLFAAAWKEGRDLDLEGVIAAVQHPPFDKVGVLDLETFFPSKDRFALVVALNNVLASPQFASWREGQPMNIARCLTTPEGKPRIAVFSIAHLGDDERMFFVSLLLNEVLAWTRAQSGTTSLRAILYMDEIFGYLPPTANPPSKRPLLTLLKQARAFGVGVVVATQNPVDLDYKALSNAGTWFLGRLQTERDKARVLDGLQGAAAGGSFDRAALERTLSGLGNRIFLLHNVHDDAQRLFETRWAMCYLRGPLTRDQIRMLTPATETPPHAQAVASPTAPTSASRPAVPPAIEQAFFEATAAAPVYRPVLLAEADVALKDRKLGIEHVGKVRLVADIPEGLEAPAWDDAPKDSKVAAKPSDGATYQTLPAAASQPKNYTGWEKELRTWLAEVHAIEILRCASPEMVSRPGEEPDAFHARLALAAREARDAAVEALRKKFAPKRDALEAKIARAEAAISREKEQASHARLQSAITIGSSLLGAFLGTKKLSASNINRAGTAMRSVSRTIQQGGDVAGAEQNAAALRSQMEELETEFAADSAALAAAQPSIEKLTLRPSRTGISNTSLRLAWLPTPPPPKGSVNNS